MTDDSNSDSDDAPSDSDIVDDDANDIDSADDSSTDSDTVVDGSDVESESETDQPTWKKCSIPVTPGHITFTRRNAGVQLSSSDIPDSILGFFQLYFTDDLIHEMVSETNRYAQEKLMNRELLPRSIWHMWTDVTEIELQAYLGVVLRMAMHQCGGIQHFFCIQWIDFMPFYADVFSRDRFHQIHWMLHVQPPSASDDSM